MYHPMAPAPTTEIRMAHDPVNVILVSGEFEQTGKYDGRENRPSPQDCRRLAADFGT